MAASFGAATASAASMRENVRKYSSYNPPLHHRPSCHRSSAEKVSFCLSSATKLRFSSKAATSGWNSSTIVRAQLNEVAVDGSPKAAPSSPAKPEVSQTVNIISSTEASSTSLASEEALSSFINQVSSLVKMVDSKDIVELQLNMLDCELLIRKKEALPAPPATVAYVQSPHPPAAIPPAHVPSPVSTAAPPAPAPAPALSPPKVQPSKSAHPPLKCPMSGTLYRSPAPGEPPFVKVGDKVRKGQVICIIEAMKLMNEIEADQSGKIVEILVEDGKPVSIDTPLFVIEP